MTSNKQVLLILAKIAGSIFLIIPSKVITKTINLFLLIVAVARPAKDSIMLLLTIEKQLHSITSREACRYNNGHHPKHRLTRYHDFFCNRLNVNEKVIDIGSGLGLLAYDMAKTGAHVTGVELSLESYNYAIKTFSHENVDYIHGDALKDLPNRNFDVAVMSNVLEHIEYRVPFLTDAQKTLNPQRWLLRVPLYERDWKVACMDELEMDYRLDPQHFIEFTQENFTDELSRAGLVIIDMQIRWGEIWCEAKPRQV